MFWQIGPSLLLLSQLRFCCCAPSFSLTENDSEVGSRKFNSWMIDKSDRPTSLIKAILAFSTGRETRKRVHFVCVCVCLHVVCMAKAKTIVLMAMHMDTHSHGVNLISILDDDDYDDIQDDAWPLCLSKASLSQHRDLRQYYIVVVRLRTL